MMMDGLSNPKYIKVKQGGDIYAFRNVKRKLHKTIAAIWFNKTCREPQLARPRPTALLSPSSDGKPEAATAVVVAPDVGREDAQNMLSCI
jgi:hypothetical protein